MIRPLLYRTARLDEQKEKYNNRLCSARRVVEEETEPDSVAVEGDSVRNSENAAAIQKRHDTASSLPFIIQLNYVTINSIKTIYFYCLILLQNKTYSITFKC